MGEARRKTSRNQRQIAAHPYCVYCGGETKGTQVDHVPPIAMFTEKLRPEGLEFTACTECHEGTRKIDLVASVFCRYFTGPNPMSELEKENLGKLIGGVMRKVPAVAADMEAMRQEAKNSQPEFLQKYRGEVYATTLGDAAQATLEAFAARLGLALHYNATGSPLPEAGAIAVHVFTNMNAMEGTLPEEFRKIFSEPKALIQKGLKAHEDFQFDTVMASDFLGTASIATFRMSFAILAICANDEKELGTEFADQFFRPGFLIGLPT